MAKSTLIRVFRLKIIQINICMRRNDRLKEKVRVKWQGNMMGWCLKIQRKKKINTYTRRWRTSKENRFNCVGRRCVCVCVMIWCVCFFFQSMNCSIWSKQTLVTVHYRYIFNNNFQSQNKRLWVIIFIPIIHTVIINLLTCNEMCVTIFHLVVGWGKLSCFCFSSSILSD